MDTFLYILWNPDLVAFRIGGFALRWYSLCWLLGLLAAFLIVRKLYQEQKIKPELFDPLFIYCFIGILIVEMVLPIHFLADGSWKFTGYEGLASHGGTIGLIIALWLYVRRTKVNLWRVLDNVAIATPVTACLIRLGNLMNSEIIGKATDVPWAFIFERVDLLPRHPGQLYEAIAYAIFFFIGWYLYRKQPQRVGTGFFFGLCITLIFTARFFIEFTKDIQEEFEASMLLNMGQLLSLPFIALGLVCMFCPKVTKRLGAEG